jgi:hypothetical protein
MSKDHYYWSCLGQCEIVEDIKLCRNGKTANERPLICPVQKNYTYIRYFFKCGFNPDICIIVLGSGFGEGPAGWRHYSLYFLKSGELVHITSIQDEYHGSYELETAIGFPRDHNQTDTLILITTEKDCENFADPPGNCYEKEVRKEIYKWTGNNFILTSP